MVLLRSETSQSSLRRDDSHPLRRHQPLAFKLSRTLPPPQRLDTTAARYRQQGREIHRSRSYSSRAARSGPLTQRLGAIPLSPSLPCLHPPPCRALPPRPHSPLPGPLGPILRPPHTSSLFPPCSPRSPPRSPRCTWLACASSSTSPPALA